MRINSISVLSNVQKFGSLKVKNSSSSGLDDDKLVMKGNASKYFVLFQNLSNQKVGSKFLIKCLLPEYEDLTLLITPESKIESDDLYIGIDKDSSSPSFKGKLYASIRQEGKYSDTKMEEEYVRFWQEGMHALVSDKYIDKEYGRKIKNDYNFFIPSDGDGTRYKDITSLQGGRTKPASYIPATLNGKNMSLVQGVISNFARTGKLDKKYEFIKVSPAKGSAFAFLEGLRTGKISTKKPIVFSWGDNFTDVNISRLLYKHEKSGSDFTISAIPVEKSKTKSLSVVKIDSLKDKSILEFVEKPQDDAYINSCVVPQLGKDKCLSVVGPYVISPRVLQWIKDKYVSNPEYFKNPDKGYDFSSMIIAQVLDAMQKGEIPKGKMKLALIKDDETWSDLGSQKDFSLAMKNISLGLYSNLPAEVSLSLQKNIDDDGNITFNTRSRNMLRALASDLNIKFENVLAYCND